VADIESIKIKNFRGVRTEVDLSLPGGQSLLLYGDNGTGKSTFLDAIEWFITDQVSHLVGEEIGKYGGLRNALCADEEESFVSLSFKTPKLSNQKALSLVKEKLKSEYVVAKTAEFESLIAALSREHLWIRNRDLVEFILGTKGKRLSDFSNIIGFDPVSSTKATLRKATNDIKTTIKHKNFQEYINSETSTIGNKLGAVVHNEEQFLKASNALLAKVAPDIKLKAFKDLAPAIKVLSGSQETLEAKQLRILQSAEAIGKDLTVSVSTFKDEIHKYIQAREKLRNDKSRLKQVVLSRLLEEASKILAHHGEDNCPLCLQKINREQLSKAISKRISDLKEVNEEAASLETHRKSISENIDLLVSTTKDFVESLEPLKSGKDSKQIASLEESVKLLEIIANDLNEPPLTQKVRYDASIYTKIVSFSKSLTDAAGLRANELKTQVSDSRIEAVAKLSVAKEAFEKSQRLKKEQEILNSHHYALDVLVTEFTKHQKDGMEVFLSAISRSINDYYIFMNEEKKVDDVKLVCLNDEGTGEFLGVAVNYRFHGRPAESPKELLSESQLNCLGLCLFLATVKEFNKKSGFVILDDVISSFDKNHRARFAQLLVSKFSDQQLLILTHETEWYEHLSYLVKSMGWKILQVRWSLEDGTSLAVSASNIKERIDEKIKTGEVDDLGNLIRRYGEQLLKEIAYEINAPVAFKFNELNEYRNFDEIYSAIRSQLKKHTDIAENEAILGLSSCQFFSTKASHDSGYKPNMADMKVALSCLEKFSDLFRCGECSRYVGTKYPNIPNKTITCKCGTKYLSWK
jgi:energy-coupling factor transporter ATP-binding protein EcfA2